MKSNRKSIACIALLAAIIFLGALIVACADAHDDEDSEIVVDMTVSDCDTLVTSFADIPLRSMTDLEPSFNTVYENHILSSCTSCGSFDAVTYDSEGIEISRQTVILPKTDHIYRITVQKPTCTDNGQVTWTCNTCGKIHIEDESPALGHDFHCGCCSRCRCIDSAVHIPPDAICSADGHRYYVYNADELSDVVSFEDAELYCEELGGHLAIIESDLENRLCFAQMYMQNYQSAYFGLSDAETENEWLTVFDESPNYVNFHAGEPNDECGNEDYAMFYWKWSDGTWNDGNFGGSTYDGGKAFICEWE